MSAKIPATMTVSINIDFDTDYVIEILEEEGKKVTAQAVANKIREMLYEDREDYFDFNELIEAKVVDESGKEIE